MPSTPDLTHLPRRGGERQPPLLFVHGAFATPWVWTRHWMPYFADAGHDTFALRLRGAGSPQHGGAGPGLADYLDDLDAAVRAIGARPVLVGHSLGALVAQMALGRVPMRALALLAPVPPTGMLWSNLRLAVRAPSLWARTVLSAVEAGFATAAATRAALFTDDADDERVREAHHNLGAQPVRPLLEAQWPRYVPRAARLGVPVLTLAAERDRLIPVDAVERTARHHGGQHVIVAGAGHAMMLDGRWRDGAEALREWLAAHTGRDAA